MLQSCLLHLCTIAQTLVSWALVVVGVRHWIICVPKKTRCRKVCSTSTGAQHDAFRGAKHVSCQRVWKRKGRAQCMIRVSRKGGSTYVPSSSTQQVLRSSANVAKFAISMITGISCEQKDECWISGLLHSIK